MSQLNFCWRLAHPDSLVEPCAVLQQTLISALKSISGVDEQFTDFQVSLSALPIKLGGIGITMPSDCLFTAYLSSILASADLQASIFSYLPPRIESTVALIDSFKDYVGVAAVQAVDNFLLAPEAKLQHNLAQLFYKAKLDRLHHHPNINDLGYASYRKLLLMSHAHPHCIATAGLLALPSPNMGQKMDRLQLQAYLRFLLHIPFPITNPVCTKCRGNVDSFGYHMLACCGKDNRRHSRHDAVAGALRSIATSAGFNAELNGKVSCLGKRADTVHSFRPADILIRGLGSRPLCVDVTIPTPLCASYGSKPIGQLVKIKAAEKKRKYDVACDNANIAFRPFTLDVCGVLEDSAYLFLNQLASGMSSNSGTSYSYSVAMCRRRISFALQWGIGYQLSPLLQVDVH
jgi:hypothetical protein